MKRTNGDKECDQWSAHLPPLPSNHFTQDLHFYNEQVKQLDFELKRSTMMKSLDGQLSNPGKIRSPRKRLKQVPSRLQNRVSRKKRTEKSRLSCLDLVQKSHCREIYQCLTPSRSKQPPPRAIALPLSKEIKVVNSPRKIQRLDVHTPKITLPNPRRPVGTLNLHSLFYLGNSCLLKISG